MSDAVAPVSSCLVLLPYLQSPLSPFGWSKQRSPSGSRCSKRRYVHVELSHKTGKVVVLEMLGEHVSGELHDIADNERRPRVVPCDQVLILLVDNHAIRYSDTDVR